MSTLILGCGYLGLRVARRLVLQGESVFGTVRSERRADALRAEGIEPVIADVLDPVSLERLPATDRTFYCVGFDRAAGSAMRTVYVDGLENVLKQLPGKTGRLVYAGSTGVYGQDDGDWIDEDAPAEPRHESGRVCLEAEMLALTFVARTALPLVILRFAGLYGPGRIPRLANIRAGEAIVGDASKFVNFVHNDDAAAATEAALTRGESGEVYHVVDDRPVPRHEFYGLIAQCLGVPAPRFVPAAPGSVEARRDESNKRISNRRLRTKLGVVLSYPDITTGIPAALSS